MFVEEAKRVQLTRFMLNVSILYSSIHPITHLVIRLVGFFFRDFSEVMFGNGIRREKEDKK